MFKQYNLVTIKTEWLEKHENPDSVYLVVGEESDNGAVKITPVECSLRFPPINTVRAECLQLYKAE
jgi:hypothetical protein